MKVHVAPPAGLSRAMTRVENALVTYLPQGNSVVKTWDEADLVVLHVTTSRETTKWVTRLREDGKRYAIIQYCFRGTHRSHAHEWADDWNGATCVWSYYPLARAWRDDPKRVGVEPIFYHAPLGIDKVFHQRPELQKRRPYTLLTTGYVAPSECLKECAEAVERVNGQMIHIGPDHEFDARTVTSKLGIFDDELVTFYQAARFVAGLRRGEGFEMPVYEGLAQGARPIVFDAPHYRHWLGEHALYVREYDYPPDMGDYQRNLDSAAIMADIATALETYAPVTSDEMAWARETFHWKPIIEGFWERAL